MGVNIYSKAQDGNKKLSPNFKVSEFACKDGSDPILISDETVAILQHVRNLIGKAINITSAYRTDSYNAKIGGAKKSQHKVGKACDTKCDYGAYILARAYQLLGAKGIGLYPYSPFCHVDTRDSKSYWRQDTKSGSSYAVSYFIDKPHIKMVQDVMNLTSFETGDQKYFCGESDGVIGKNTRTAFAYFCDNAPLDKKKEVISIIK